MCELSIICAGQNYRKRQDFDPESEHNAEHTLLALAASFLELSACLLDASWSLLARSVAA